jgi:hypothetical protein
MLLEEVDVKPKTAFDQREHDKVSAEATTKELLSD